MKYRVFKRDVLKLIAVISMIIDHIGKLFFPNFLFLQIIGRLAMPIFAFFIAEGFYYTKNKAKYLLTIFIFAILSQIPYNYMWHGLNILFTFTLSLALLFMWEFIKKCSIFPKIISNVSSAF